ncbi:MAG: hypothetical protein QW726_05685, partial [Fervidicoccaceae archaeon]
SLFISFIEILASKLFEFVLPWEVVKKVIENMSEEERKEMMDELYRMSSWYAELAKVKRGSSLLELKNTISIWIPSANLDIAEEDGSYKIIVSFRDSQSSLLDFAERIVEGLLKGYGLKMIGKERKSSLLVFKVTGFYE